ncbi:ribonuclease R [Defluviitalea phaphyphila]|uniref:ribonuclease R n=1 Tax=Defluviitalea phaphyphila TaxID=1473580 RepID=UPI000B3035B6|nr:ribonuclease R [Defluviitalea phaphyphila]
MDRINIKEKKELILDFMKHKDYVPMKIKELMMILQVPNKERKLLEQILEELIKEGKVIRTKRGKYAIPETLNMVIGTFQGNPKGYGFVILEDPDAKDIFIPASSVNGAMHKDKVLCKITKSAVKEKSAEGEIIQIIERGSDKIVGTYEQSKYFGFVIPDDKNFAKDIFISKGHNLGAVDGHKVVAKITNWGKDRRNPEGEIIEILGHINDPNTDILAIIKQFDIPTDFPEEVMKYIETIPQEVQKEDMIGREDLRDVRMVTIDGEDAKDLDDAISLEKLPNGLYRLGVHIADVSHYVKENSPLDKEALNRGTSIYLVDRVIPMLPHKLSNGICSLNAGVDRLALSCIMDIDKNGNVKDHRIVETVINIDERMSYTNVKKILVDQDKELMDRYKDYIDFFKLMEELCIILNKKREKRGAIDFDFEEAKIILDEEGRPIDIKPYERNIATKIIEEFMLVCNETIAEDYFWQGTPFIYRSHQDPDPEKILKLSTFIHNFGYHIKGTNNIHSKDLQKILSDIEGKPEENVISRLILRSMQQARYTVNNDGHFGLAAKYYCHFTSPIRRYPDLQIHRIIKANINGTLDERKQNRLKKKMPEIAKHCSIKERTAEEAERQTEQLKKVEYMKDKIGEVYDGIISGITSWGMYVELPNTVEGLVHITEMDDDYYIFDEQHYLLIGEKRKKIYRLGDKVKVKLIKADMIQRTINFSLIMEDDDKNIKEEI